MSNVSVLGPEPTPGRLPGHVVFALPNWGDAATWTANKTAVSGEPLSNVTTRQPSMVAGFDVSASALVLSGTGTEPLDVVSIPYANATPAATWKVNIGDSDNEAVGSHAYDASGNGLHGTIQNAAQHAAGKYESGLDCDNAEGATTTKGILTPQDAAIAGADKTYMLWVNPRRFGPAGQTLVFHPGSDGTSADIILTAAGRINAQNGSDADEAESAPLTLGYWTHVAVSYASSTGALTIYLDGEEVSTVTLDNDPGFGNGDSTLFWGGTSAGSGGGFDGILDDCRFYSAALTEAEIQTEMQTETPTVTASLVLQYKLNAYQSGTLTFGAPPNRADYDRRASWLFLPYQMTAQVVRITITDPTNPEPLRIGRLVVGTAWQPPLNFDFGWRIGFIDRTKTGFTPTSQTTSNAPPPVPVAEFTIRHLSRDEIMDHAYEMQRVYGGFSPFLVCCDPEDESHLQRLLIYGLLKDMQPFPNVYFNGWETSYRVEAML